MTMLTHQSPLGPLEIPGVYGTPAPGEPFDVDFQDAVVLLDQGDLYQVPGGLEVLTVDELKTIADHRHVSLAGATTKKDILAAIDAADAEEASA